MGTPAALLIINNEELIKNHVDYAISKAKEIFDKFVETIPNTFLARKHFDGHADSVVSDIEKMVSGQKNTKEYGLEFDIQQVAANLIFFTGAIGKRYGKKYVGPHSTWVPVIPDKSNQRKDVDGHEYVLVLDAEKDKFVLKRSFWDFDDQVLKGKPRYDLLRIEYKPTRPQDLTTDEEWYKMKPEKCKAIWDQCKANQEALEQIAEKKIRELEENLKKESLTVCDGCIVYPLTINENCNQPCDKYTRFYKNKESKILEWSQEFYVENTLKNFGIKN
jgi:hypothetical protein